MTQVNLLPGDVKERLKTRRLTAAVVMAAGAVVALMFFIFILQSARLADANHTLAAQQATNAKLQSKVTQLEGFSQLKTLVATREALAAAATDGEVLWSGVLRDVSMVIPDKVFLTGMSASVNDTSVAAPVAPAPTATPETGATPTPGETATPTTPAPPVAQPGSTLIGTIQFQGVADDHPSVAQWLTRLEQVTGWANPWISNATESDQNGQTDIQWSGTLDLTVEATVQRGVR